MIFGHHRYSKLLKLLTEYHLFLRHNRSRPRQTLGKSRDSCRLLSCRMLVLPKFKLLVAHKQMHQHFKLPSPNNSLSWKSLEFQSRTKINICVLFVWQCRRTQLRHHAVTNACAGNAVSRLGRWPSTRFVQSAEIELEASLKSLSEQLS